MTEEIIENEEAAFQEAVQNSVPKGLVKRFRLLGKNRKIKKNRVKGPDDLNKLEITLVSVTGVVTFGGIMFCSIMVVLFKSLHY